jgi:hypothetical protein
MKKEIDVPFSVGKKASEIIKFLQKDKSINFGEALDALSMALVVSAFNAGVSKKEFMDNTNAFWDGIMNEMNDTNKTLH